MNFLGALSQGGINMADMAWNLKCRQEDLDHRQREIGWHDHSLWCRWVDEQWHAMDEKCSQLEQIANLSALLSGFSLVAVCQVSIPEDLNGDILTVFGFVTALAVGASLLAMLTSTLVLVGVMKYDPKVQNQGFNDFKDFWETHCETDWVFCFRCYNVGVALFLMVLGGVGWVQFFGHTHYIRSAALVSVIALCCGIFYYGYTHRKWATFLTTMTERNNCQTVEANRGAGVDVEAAHDGVNGRAWQAQAHRPPIER